MEVCVLANRRWRCPTVLSEGALRLSTARTALKPLQWPADESLGRDDH